MEDQISLLRKNVEAIVNAIVLLNSASKDPDA